MRGIVERIVYQNVENGWSVLRVRFDDGVHTVVGNLGGVSVGSTLEGEFEAFIHPKFGHQLKPVKVHVKQDVAPAAIGEWLVANVNGIGERKAERIMAVIGEDTKKLGDPETLMAVKGVSKPLAERIALVWKEKGEEAATVSSLISIGLTNAYAVRVVKEFGPGAANLVRENPYILTKVRGIGFKMADSIARELGIRGDDPRRVLAAAEFAVQQIAEKDGHTAQEMEDVLQLAESLGLTKSLLRDGVKKLIQSGELVSEGGRVGLSWLYEAESDIRKLSRIKIKKDWRVDVYNRAKEQLVGKLTEEQLSVPELLARSRVAILTGGPGTGKSHALSVLIPYLMENGMDVQVAAPTGKAAARLRRSGLKASTIHSLFKFNGTTWGITETNPLHTDLLVIDEASMVDTPLMARVFRSVTQTTQVLLVGDANQLPSVGPGQVLRDLIDSGVPTVELKRVFRQAKDSPIVRAAYQVLSGSTPRSVKVEEPDVEKVVELAAEYWNSGSDVQVLAPKYQGPLGVHTLNALIKERVNGPKSPKRTMFGLVGKRGAKLLGGEAHVGDPIVCNQNNYNLEVMNGEVGIVRDVQDGEMFVEFHGRNGLVKIPRSQYRQFSLAYAITIHRSQGSEWANVIMVLGKDAYIMANREIIYTGLTRAKQNLHLFADRRILAIGVKRRASKRKTWLRYWEEQ